MSEVTPLLPEIQKRLLESHHHRSLGKRCKCGKEAIFRCSDKCWKSPMMCAECIVSKHLHQPFHHIDQWDGLHFVRTSLHALGLKLQTDPESDERPCHNVSDTLRVSRDMVVVDDNGFHSARIEFCACPGPNDKVPAEWEQLVDMRLFPATWKRPQTVFTFSVLRQFHVHSLTSKKSAHDYIRALAKLTDSTFPQDVKVESFASDGVEKLTYFRIGAASSSTRIAFGDSLASSAEPAKHMVSTSMSRTASLGPSPCGVQPARRWVTI